MPLKDPIARASYWRKYNGLHKKEHYPNHLRSKYGIIQYEYAIVFKKQEGKCIGCYAIEGLKNHRLFLDYNHITGKIRGLLCGCCSFLIGHAKEKPEVLRRLANYLEMENTNGQI